MSLQPLSYLRALPLAAQLGLAVGVLAATVGSAQLALSLAYATEGVRLPEYDRRLASWSPAYGFATACGSGMRPKTSVILLNPLIGSGETPPDELGFDPDASHFAYPLLPRVVSVRWDLSSPWVPHQGEAEYVALWLQATLRTPAAQAAGSLAEQNIGALPFARLVCTYESQLHDRGLLYAIGSNPGAATLTASSSGPPAALGVPYQSFVGLARVCIALLSLWLMGSMVQIGLARRVPRRVVWALGLPVGCLGAAFELAVFSFLHVVWQLPTLVLPWIALGLAVVVRQRGRRLDESALSTIGMSWWHRPMRLAPSECIALIVLALLAGLLFLLAPLGIPRQDGFSAGYFKAAVFLADGSILPFYQHAQSYFYAQPTHPPLVALTLDWIYQFTGGTDEHATLVLWPALLCSVLAALYALIRNFVSRPVALWSLVAIAFAAFDLTNGAVAYGFTDLPLALFLLGGVGALWLWGQQPTGTSHLLLASGLLLAGAAWTKEEGIVSGPISFLIVVWLAQHNRAGSLRRWWLAPLLFGAVYAGSIVPLLVVRLSYPAPENILHAASLSDVLLRRLPIVLLGVAARVVQHWFLPLTLVALAMWRLRSARNLKRSLSAALFWVPACVVVAQLGADVVGIGFNPLDVTNELSWAAGRLLMQLTPLVYLAAISLCQTAVTSPTSDSLRQVRPLSATRLPALPVAAADTR